MVKDKHVVAARFLSCPRLEDELHVNEIEKDLRAMTADGAAWSVMVGIGETYLPAFVLALSSSQLAAGLVATIPLMAGALLQLISPYAVRRLRSYRRWVVFCAIFQAAAFVPLVIAAARGEMPVVLVFALASLYWAAAMATGPAWNNWVETLVPRDVRPRYFAHRTRVSQMGLLVGFVAGGLVLQAAPFTEPLAAFALLFLVAGTSRLISAHYLSSQREPVPPGQELCLPGLAELARSFRRDIDRSVLGYLLAMQLAVWMAAPYFTPYMLVHLRLSYANFVLLTCAAFASKTAAAPLAGWAIERWGSTRVLWMSGLIVAPLPALWMVSDAYPYLLALQLLAGAGWAAYELAMLMAFFDSIAREKRLSILTLFNVANAMAIVTGSLIGGLLIGFLGAGPETYMILFAVSAGSRVAALRLLVPIPQFGVGKLLIATRPIAIRPTTGPLERPVLASMETAGVSRRVSETCTAAVNLIEP